MFVLQRRFEAKHNILTLVLRIQKVDTKNHPKGEPHPSSESYQTFEWMKVSMGILFGSLNRAVG
jgi:hypothetical protein